MWKQLFHVRVGISEKQSVFVCGPMRFSFAPSPILGDGATVARGRKGIGIPFVVRASQNRWRRRRSNLRDCRPQLFRKSPCRLPRIVAIVRLRCSLETYENQQKPIQSLWHAAVERFKLPFVPFLRPFTDCRSGDDHFVFRCGRPNLSVETNQTIVD